MGRDKASIVIDARTGETLARRLGRLLAEVADAVLEVGPGWSGLERAEADLGEGPLTGIAAGWESLRSGAPGTSAPFEHVIVLATDLPAVTPGLLAWLATRPEAGSVVPVVGGRTQPLCARWCGADLERAVEIVHGGGRAVSTALGPETAYLGESEWGAVASEGDFRDADRPEDLAAGGP
jgi:molybdopterin-guanine dinucleotide biosynthesis protein A